MESLQHHVDPMDLVLLPYHLRRFILENIWRMIQEQYGTSSNLQAPFRWYELPTSPWGLSFFPGILPTLILQDWSIYLEITKMIRNGSSVAPQETNRLWHYQWLNAIKCMKIFFFLIIFAKGSNASLWSITLLYI